MWLQNVMDIPLGCHGATDQYYGWPCIVAMAPHSITVAVGAVCCCKSSFLVRGTTPNGGVDGKEYTRNDTVITNVLQPGALVWFEKTQGSLMKAGGVIGSYFFKNDDGHNVTVNGDRYRAMITNFSIPELNNHNVQELWFQQDGITCHTARPTID
ncbi:hypothetical protein TNCV_4486311 [Trichonephila clavipes]|nr:hypothetical protein TNCV_4486311 [Trichonephila clavipes]